MATVNSNRQNYYPPISPNPTAAEMALHLKNLYTFANTTDQAINILNGKVTSPISSSASGSSGTSTLVTKTIVVSQLSGLGGLNDQTGSTSYTPTAADAGIFLIFGDTAPVAVTLNSAMVTPYIFFATNNNSGVVTLTPTTGLVNGAASWPMQQGGLFLVGFDGVNWKTSDVLILAQTFNAVTHEFLTAYNAATGLFSAAQPVVADVVGAAPIASPTFTGTVTQPDATVLTAATTAATATAGTGVLPAAPQLFLDVTINSVAYRIPLYLP
jgi:hypothetical protein